MHFVRLLPAIFTTILFAAHLSRNGDNIWAIIVLILLGTLAIKHKLVLRAWQTFILITGLVWIKVAANLVQLRMDTGMPWTRLLIIMIAIVLFCGFSALWMEKKKIKSYYGF